MKAVFFDKDGTLIKNVPYNVQPDLIELNAGAAETVQKLKQAGLAVFVVSNQSGVARGFFAETDLAAVWARLNELCGIEIDGFYFCPHLENGKIAAYSFACDCRKPKAGMIWQAAREYEIDLSASWLVGDSAADIEAGKAAGCQTILFGEAGKFEVLQPDCAVQGLPEIVEIVLREQK